MPTLLFANEVYRIQGAIFDVHREMGGGFLESVYQECLASEFRRREVPFDAQCSLRLSYKGDPLRQSFVADFVCFGQVLIELKAVRILAPEHRAQVINYLRATGLKLGLLVNFGPNPKVEIERLVL